MTNHAKLKRLKDAHSKLYSTLDKFCDLGMAFDGPLPDAVHSIESVAIAATAESVGVSVESLEWFIYDNQWGKRKRVCCYPGKEDVVIDSIKAFLKFEEGAAPCAKKKNSNS
jgi:hypothetical protein